MSENTLRASLKPHRIAELKSLQNHFAVKTVFRPRKFRNLLKSCIQRFDWYNKIQCSSVQYGGMNGTLFTILLRFCPTNLWLGCHTQSSETKLFRHMVNAIPSQKTLPRLANAMTYIYVNIFRSNLQRVF